jgi:ApbE superfamily uncharacterized protein (UPF0280 family)
MSEEKVKYWEDRIYEAHTYTKGFALNELVDIAVKVEQDEELTKEEKEKVLSHLQEMMDYVEERPEEYD